MTFVIGQHVSFMVAFAKPTSKNELFCLNLFKFMQINEIVAKN